MELSKLLLAMWDNYLLEVNISTPLHFRTFEQLIPVRDEFLW